MTEMSELKQLRIPSGTKKIIIRPVAKVANPILIKKTSLQNFDGSNRDLLKHLNLDASMRDLFREEIVYKSKPGDFLGNTHSITIVNRVNLFKNSNRTVATYSTRSDDLFFEKTSDSVTTVIGQKNYDILFTSLSSIQDEELKIKGLLSLLTLAKKLWDTACQTEDRKFSADKEILTEDKNVQTDQTSIIENRFKPKHKVVKRKHITPYVVQDQGMETQKSGKRNKKTDFKDTGSKTTNPSNVKTETKIEQLTDLKHDVDFLHDDRSTESSVSNISNISTASEVTKLLDSIALCTNNQEEIIVPDSFPTNINTTESTPSDSNTITTESTNVENPSLSTDTLEKTPLSYNLKVMEFNTETINPTMIRMMDGTDICVPMKPDDHFHIATPKILACVTKEEKAKLLKYQAYIDWKFCDVRDEDGFLPIHVAVRNNDVTLLRRQCYMLNKKGLSVDEPACNMTALHMSLFNESPACLKVLLSYGGDPFCEDEEDRNLVHLAAETPAAHLDVILRHCRQKARQILQEHEELSYANIKDRSDNQVAQYLLDHICNSMDGQGYTPLMLASKAGLPANVKLLAEASPSSVSKTMANSGNTALFLAVGEACLDADRRGNRQKLSDNFRRTIELLLQHGADPTTENFSGSTISDLLQEINVPEIPKIIGNYTNPKNENNYNDSLNPLIIVKKEKEDMDENKDIKNVTTKRNKPIIIENIPLKSARLNVTPSQGKCLKPVSPAEKIKKIAAPKKRANLNRSQVKKTIKTDSQFAIETKPPVTIKQESDKADFNEFVVNKSSIGNMVVQNNFYVNETAYTANANTGDDRKGQIAVVSSSIGPQRSIKSISAAGNRIIILDPTNSTIATQGNVLNLPQTNELNVLGEFLVPKKQNSNVVQVTASQILNIQSNIKNEVEKVEPKDEILVPKNEFYGANVNLNVNNELSYEVALDNTNISKNVIIQTLPSDGTSKINILRLKRKTKLAQSDVSAKTSKNYKT